MIAVRRLTFSRRVIAPLPKRLVLRFGNLGANSQPLDRVRQLPVRYSELGPIASSIYQAGAVSRVTTLCDPVGWAATLRFFIHAIRIKSPRCG
jgi:hypothetical protein